MKYDIAVIGGGIVGAATFYKLQKKFPNLSIVLFEKEKVLADHQTGNNSGVIHSGLYYKPGSLKARNCIQGRKELVQFAKDYNIAHDVCGKVVVATDQRELPNMDKIFNTGLENGIEARYLVFCAGLQADRLARKDGVDLKEQVVGFRGDYYELTPEARYKVKNLIYPVPNPDFPFLGVHFTRMTDGEIECGPNAVFTFKREGYGKTDFSLRDTYDALTYKGTWKLFFNNMSFGINEYRRAFSKKLFLKTLQRMIPSLTMEDIHPGRSGVRALLLAEDGDTRDDFRIEYHGNSIHVLNAPSPAATASLAIGEYIAVEAQKHFSL